MKPYEVCPKIPEEPQLEILFYLHNLIEKDKANWLTNVSQDNDNKDGEIIFTCLNREFVLSSNNIEEVEPDKK